MRAAASITDDVERVPGGRTFFWQGGTRLGLNSRQTLETELNVFEDFEPKLSEAALAGDVLFLAQHPARPAARGPRAVPAPASSALDSMNLWIDIARDVAGRAIARSTA